MTKLGILVPAALVTLFFLASCQQPNGLATNSNTPTGVCLNCHTASYALIGAAAANKAGYEFSGHKNGLRELSSSGVETRATTALDETAAGCSKCHTSSGFVAWNTNGPGATTSTAYSDIANTSILVNGGAATPDPVDCLTCHNPHSQTWEITLRETKPVALPSGMFTSTSSKFVFSGGDGNLCVNCHQDRTTPDSLMTKFLGKVSLSDPSTNNNLPALSGGSNTGTSADTYLTVGRMEHHGVQSDFMLGVDSAGSVANTTSQPVASSGTYKPVSDVAVIATLDANGNTTSDAWLGNAYNYTSGGGTYFVNSTNPAFASSVHYSASFKGTDNSTQVTSPADTCVTCHVTMNSNSTPGEQSSHGMYLKTAAGDYVTVCATCHTGSYTYTPASSATPVTVTSAQQSGIVPIAATANATTFNTVVVGSKIKPADIAAAYAKLIDYFGNASNFYNAPVKYWKFNNDTTPASATLVFPALLSVNSPGPIVSVATLARMTMPNSYTNAELYPNWQKVVLTGVYGGTPVVSRISPAAGGTFSAKFLSQKTTSPKNYAPGDSTTAAVPAAGYATTAQYLYSPIVDSGSLQYSSSSGTIYGVDWTLNSTGADGLGNYMTTAQAQAFWNLMLFAEDRSNGIHNPLYAAQILFDALTLLTITPSTVVASWTTRPSTY